MALALPLLLALLGATPGPPGRVLTVATGLGAPGGGCGVPPSTWCQDWVTALRCGALGRCPHLAQGHPDMDICAVCQQLFDFLHQASNHSTVEVPAGVGDRCHCGGHGQRCHHSEALAGLCHAEAVSRRARGRPGRAHLWGARHLSAGTGTAWGWRWPCGHRHGHHGAGEAQARSVPSTGCSVPLPQGSGGAGLAPEALPLPLCWLCRSLVARAEAAVPVSAVAAAVAGLCRALPLPLAGACQCLAQRYAALALEGLLGRLGPRLLCRLLLACRSGDNGDVGTLPPPWVLEAIVVRLAECISEEDPKGVGVPALSLPLGPCALGPTFWCSGPEAAQRCQALQHCQEHVWL
ncbi:hypothetical protein Nmel_018527 [Mimus melanotis]